MSRVFVNVVVSSRLVSSHRHSVLSLALLNSVSKYDFYDKAMKRPGHPFARSTPGLAGGRIGDLIRAVLGLHVSLSPVFEL